jgi:hypothetical protein
VEFSRTDRGCTGGDADYCDATLDLVVSCQYSSCAGDIGYEDTNWLRYSEWPDSVSYAGTSSGVYTARFGTCSNCTPVSEKLRVFTAVVWRTSYVSGSWEEQFTDLALSVSTDGKTYFTLPKTTYHY